MKKGVMSSATNLSTKLIFKEGNFLKKMEWKTQAGILYLG